MNQCRTMFGLLVLGWASAAFGTRPDNPTTLEKAFENGCSLVVAEILSVRREGGWHYYKAKIVRTIIAGDLEKAEAQSPPEIAAEASEAEAIKPGSQYAIFTRRDCPYQFTLAFPDETVEVKPSDREMIRRLVEAADRVYAGTSIRQFRRTRPWVKAWANSELPALPDELALLCKQFREGSGRRAELGRQIAESDLGSRQDYSDIESSISRYLPPKIALSRRQVLVLFGEPTWMNGWTYLWRCDDFVHAQEGGTEIGILSVTFDKSEIAIRVVYGMQARSNWIRPAKPNDQWAELDGDPGGVARRFLEALRQSNWDQALSLCSPAVKAKALRAASAEVFFRQFVPVGKLAALSQFQPRGRGSRDGKVIEVSAEVDIDVPEAQWPVRWNWSLVRADRTWLVDFGLVPLDQFIQKELLKSEFLNSGVRRPKMSERDLSYILTPITSEFVIGRPMLLSLEIKNEGTDPVACGRISVAVNDPMLVTGPDGETISYVDTGYQTAGGIDVILPGEAIVLADQYDVTSQYRIIRPGRYTFQFRGTHPGGKPSNVLEVDVKPGPLSGMEQIVERLLPVLPAGWKFTRHMASAGDDASAQLLYVHLIGQPRGKGGDKGVLFLIIMGGDPAGTNPWLKEQFDLWGLSSWGPVYAQVNDADQLWPNHRTEITRVLEITSP